MSFEILYSVTETLLRQAIFSENEHELNNFFNHIINNELTGFIKKAYESYFTQLPFENDEDYKKRIEYGLKNTHSIYFDIENKTIQNIKEIVYIIWEKEYHKEWKNEFLYDDEFKTIASTPIYIPSTYPDVLSGEYILFLLHGDKIKFAWINFEGNEDNKRKKYVSTGNADQLKKMRDRFFGSNKDNIKSSLLRQLETTLNITLNNYDKHQNSPLWEFLNMFVGIDETSFPETYDETAKKKRVFQTAEKSNKAPNNRYGGTPLIKLLETPYYDIFNKKDVMILNNDDIRLTLLKTVIFQNLPSVFRQFAINYISYVVLYLNTIYQIIETSICYSKATKSKIEEFDDLKITQYTFKKELHDDFSRLLGSESKKYSEQLSHQILYLIIFIAIIQKSVFRVKTEYSHFIIEHIKPHSKDIRDTLMDMRKINPQDYSEQNINFIIDSMQVKSWKDFMKKYEEGIKSIFDNVEEEKLKKLWNLSVKCIVYIYPERFGIFLNNAKDAISKSPSDSDWFSKYHIDIGKIYIYEIVYMMEILLQANQHKEETISHKLFGLDDGKKKTLYQLLDNIRNYENDEFTRWLRKLIVEYFPKAFLLEEKEFEDYKSYQKIILENCEEIQTENLKYIVKLFSNNTNI